MVFIKLKVSKQALDIAAKLFLRVFTVFVTNVGSFLTSK